MMKEYFGLNLPNVNFHSADFLCYSSCAKKIDPPKYAIDYVHKYMAMAEIAEIGSGMASTYLGPTPTVSATPPTTRPSQ